MDIRTIFPKYSHYQTIIILHGMNQDIDDIMYIVNKIKSKKIGTKFIIPIAKKMKIVWSDGKIEECISWYNYFTRYDNLNKHDIINFLEFNENTDKIVDIINEESKIISPEMISLIGISQGGTICINAALKLKFKIKNIKCIDTIFLHTYYKYKKAPSQHFQVLQSKKDEIYNPSFQNHCYSLLRSYNNIVKIHIRDNFHCENTDSIIRYILKTM